MFINSFLEVGRSFANSAWMFKTVTLEGRKTLKKPPFLVKCCSMLPSAAYSLRAHVILHLFWKNTENADVYAIFPWLKLIKTSPCPPESSGFIHFFGGPSVGWADLHFSDFSVPLFEIEIIAISQGFSIFCGSWKRPFQEPRRFFKFDLGSCGGAFHDVRLPTNADGNTTFLYTCCLNVVR